jgi:DNA-binding transcriptional LysR family regulator
MPDRRDRIIAKNLSSLVGCGEQSAMDRFDAMRLFVRLVERQSFTAAAADLGIPRSTASEVLRGLEARLGARLLERTTRHVTPTLDGEDYYRRCVAILAEVEEAETTMRDARPRGLLRIDAHPLLTRTFILPHLPEFLARHPQLDLQIGQGDRLVDLVREGIDCAIRSGEPEDSGMILRRLGTVEEITVASPGYLASHGLPATPDTLDGHQMVAFISSRTGDVLPLEFSVADAALRALSAKPPARAPPARLPRLDIRHLCRGEAVELRSPTGKMSEQSVNPLYRNSETASLRARRSNPEISAERFWIASLRSY